MIDIIPLPKRITRQSSRFAWGPHPLRIYHAFDTPRWLAALGSKTSVVAVDDAGQADVILRVDERAAPFRSLDEGIRRQAYRLTIRPQGIDISGAGDQGLFYGWLTLRQLIARHGRTLPACEIVDWPDLAWRGVHLDLWANAPTFKELKKFVIDLAGYKINSVCLEYDDHFQFDRHPLLAHAAAYTKDQLRELIELAGALFVDIVPLLDSLGHAETYLQHKPYMHLRELPDQIHEMCPSNPRTLAFIQDLWEEVLEVHRSAKYAHISGDEVFRLGRLCSRCSRRIARRPMAALYTSYYTKLSRWIRERGKVPIIWSDMLIKCPEDLSHFPKDILIQDWCYYGCDQPWWDSPQYKWHPIFSKYGALLEARDVGRKRFPASWPKRDRDLLACYWVRSLGKRQFYPFPHVRFLQDHGFQVMGAAAASDESSPIVPWPLPSRRFANAKRFAEMLKREGSLGLVNTFWSCHGSVKEAWYGFLAGADFAWHVRDEPEQVFAGRFVRRYLDAPEPCARAILELDRQINAERYGYRSARKFEMLAGRARALASSLATLRKRCRREPDYAHLLERIGGMNRSQTQRLANALRRLDRGRVAGRDQCLDLKDWANRDFYNAAQTQQHNPMLIDSGQHEIGGIRFDVINPLKNQGHSLVVLKGARAPDGVDVVRAVPIYKKVSHIYLLLTGYYVQQDVKLADLTINFANGWTDAMPLIGGVHVGDWDSGQQGMLLRHAILAWSHENKRCAFVTWWRNPSPQKEIQTLDLISAQADGNIMLLAMTARVLE